MGKKESAMITTVQEMLSVDLLGEKGIVVRFHAEDGEEHHVQFPLGEARAMGDMIAIALSRMPAIKQPDA